MKFNKAKLLKITDKLDTVFKTISMHILLFLIRVLESAIGCILAFMIILHFFKGV